MKQDFYQFSNFDEKNQTFHNSEKNRFLFFLKNVCLESFTLNGLAEGAKHIEKGDLEPTIGF